MYGLRGSRKAQCLKVAVGIQLLSGMICLITKYNPPDDYNSWQETPNSEQFKDKLDTEVILVEGNTTTLYLLVRRR